MTQAVIRVDSNALATAANNALAFLPANSQVKVARMRVAPTGIEFTATDTYAAGKDVCDVDEFRGDRCVVFVSREALQGFDSVGRKDKKGIGVLTVVPGTGVTFDPQDSALEAVSVVDLLPQNRGLIETFKAIDEMIQDRLDDDLKTAFQPSLLMKFSKVKADKSERVADLLISDPDAPVLVKIGTTFKGLIMPVYRDKHAKAIGEEGLW